MGTKETYIFNFFKPDHGDQEEWYELLFSNSKNQSYIGFNAECSAWGDIYHAINQIPTRGPESPINSATVYGPAVNITKPTWPFHIDSHPHSRYKMPGNNIYKVNILDLLPANHTDELYYVCQEFNPPRIIDGYNIETATKIEKGLGENGIFCPILNHIDKSGVEEYYANLHQWTKYAINKKKLFLFHKDMFTNWLTPDSFYSSYYGLHQIAKDSETHKNEKLSPWLMNINKKSKKYDEFLSLDEILTFLRLFQVNLGVDIYGFYYK